MAKIPDLKKEEYIRLEIAKAYIAASPDIGVQFIRDYTIRLTEAILNPDKADAGPNGPTAKF